jgi:hypothetical protein
LRQGELVQREQRRQRHDPRQPADHEGNRNHGSDVDESLDESYRGQADRARGELGTRLEPGAQLRQRGSAGEGAEPGRRP